MAIENWIDKIADLCAEVSDGRGGYVLAYRCFDKANFPEAITSTPCAITYPLDMTPQYSDAGPCIDIWTGQSEFHLSEDTNKALMPLVMRYFARIKAAFALHRSLGGAVNILRLTRLQGPITLTYGLEAPHWGIMATWTVKDNTSGDFTLGT